MSHAAKATKKHPLKWELQTGDVRKSKSIWFSAKIWLNRIKNTKTANIYLTNKY
jgi:hypothetical protein